MGSFHDEKIVHPHWCVTKGEKGQYYPHKKPLLNQDFVQHEHKIKPRKEYEVREDSIVVVSFVGLFYFVVRACIPTPVRYIMHVTGRRAACLDETYRTDE